MVKHIARSKNENRRQLQSHTKSVTMYHEWQQALAHVT
uniref:Uncharacterized protein n=1 Tax=Rhizophora mucronata TaxID=61149 RepID=A0A2P2P782_RHIMU